MCPIAADDSTVTNTPCSELPDRLIDPARLCAVVDS